MKIRRTTPYLASPARPRGAGVFTEFADVFRMVVTAGIVFGVLAVLWKWLSVR